MKTRKLRAGVEIPYLGFATYLMDRGDGVGDKRRRAKPA
jgi:hypothetical protein